MLSVQSTACRLLLPLLAKGVRGRSPRAPLVFYGGYYDPPIVIIDHRRVKNTESRCLSLSGGKKENRRQRNWVFIVYPESAPEDWRDRLDDFRIPWVESPLHDMDINPGTGEIKKPHWHICLVADGVKSFEQICEITGSVNGTIPQPVFSLRGQIRYFAHLDNPEKHQYSVDSIIAHMGADLEAYLMPTRSQRYRYIADMLQWCRDNDVIEFQDLMDYAMAERMEDWFPLLCDSCAIVVSNYLKSSRNRRILKEKYDIED